MKNKMSKNKTPFHLGVWIENSGESLRHWARKWGMSPGYLSKCARYQRKLGGYHRKGNKKPYSEVVFKDIPVSYRDYLDGYYRYSKTNEAQGADQ